MSMDEFDDSELICGSASSDQADLKFLCGAFSRLVHTTEEQSEKCESMEAMLVEIQKTLSQLSNQFGIRPIDAESSRQTPPVTYSSDPYIHDDHARLQLDNSKSLFREIEMPQFDGSNASDWLSKVERFFRVGRYSDLDKLDLVAFSLEGDVLKWFNWEMTRNEFHSWDEFRRRLFRRFGAAPEEAPDNRLFALKQKGTISAYVTEFEELSAQVIGLEDSHLAQIFDNGLQTEMKEVLKLKEPMGLANPKPVVLMETFTSKPVASVNFLSFEVGTEKPMSSGLSHNRLVWEPGGVIVAHVLVDWLVDFNGYDGILDGIRRLAIDSRRASRVWERGGLDISTIVSFNLQSYSSWCGWLVFDRGKNIKILGDVITLKRDDQTMLVVKAKAAHGDSLIVRIEVILSCGVALRKQIQWAEAQKLSLYKEFWIEIMDEDITKLLNSNGGKLQIYGSVLEVTIVRELRVHGASGLRLFLCQQKFSSIWHRWRRKDSDLEVQLQERALVQSSVSPALLDEAVGIPEVGCSYCQDFASLYPAFKLEDKLVFRGESIDTIQCLVDDVAGSSSQRKDSNCERSFAVDISRTHIREEAELISDSCDL